MSLCKAADLHIGLDCWLSVVEFFGCNICARDEFVEAVRGDVTHAAGGDTECRRDVDAESVRGGDMECVIDKDLDASTEGGVRIRDPEHARGECPRGECVTDEGWFRSRNMWLMVYLARPSKVNQKPYSIFKHESWSMEVCMQICKRCALENNVREGVYIEYNNEPTVWTMDPLRLATRVPISTQTEVDNRDDWIYRILRRIHGKWITDNMEKRMQCGRVIVANGEQTKVCKQGTHKGGWSGLQSQKRMSAVEESDIVRSFGPQGQGPVPRPV
ncbi:hypothetical protein BDN70DRAFT_899949 [Pholiota conissans]|uniref:Uncharacterized protein n=1 Tax=Pholiota conissans TaxID=109636 RepID=A0A9P5YSL9_9AGAR|nr:hypothetical protein BDN70DRAFT_899949 [Pholiota conissans]